MAISKTKNKTYRVRLYYPQDIQERLGVGKLYSKTFKTRKEAKEAEIDFYASIKEIRESKDKTALELGGEALFKDFYEEVWLDAYIAGLTSTNTNPPTAVTVANTKDVFRLHILPMFGKYTLNHLNHNKALVLKVMTKKAAEYANFKTLRSYVNSIFDWAEELEYIERNKLEKSLKRIKATKKNQLKDGEKRGRLIPVISSSYKNGCKAAQEDYEKVDCLPCKTILYSKQLFSCLTENLRLMLLNGRMLILKNLKSRSALP